MVKNVTALGRSGLQDWLWQRVSALVILVAAFYYGYLVFSGVFSSYKSWQLAASTVSFKVITMLLVLALSVHSWIGLWTVTTDYLKNLFLRVTVQILMIISVVSYVVWALVIFWK